jgi:cytidine deaminase
MTDTIDADQLARLKRVRERAYAPYSGFHVAAAVESEAGDHYFGCNVEVAHFKSVCAEASAISAMIAGGGRRLQRVVILTSGDEPCPPCGDCRQRLREFADGDAEILLIDEQGRARRRYTVDELLPEAFGGDLLSPR